MTIWKYVLPLIDEVEKPMQIGAKILKVDNQREEIYVWALVDEHEDTEQRRFRIYENGQKIESDAEKYVGSAIFADGGLEFHVFDEGMA